MTEAIATPADLEATLSKLGAAIQRRQSSDGIDVDELAYRPALVRFVEDAAEELEQFRKDGYRDRRGLLEGLHRLVYFTMGRLPDDFYREAATSRALLSVLVTGSERATWNRRNIPPDAGREERRRLAAVYLRPAVRAAFRELRKEAEEYVEDDDLVDPSDLSHFAARPALNELYVRQVRILSRWLDGFDDRDDVDSWLDTLDLATYSEHEGVAKTIDYELTCNPVEERVLFGEIDGADREREHQAATWLIPAFNRTIPLVLSRAGELPEEPETDDLQAKPL